MPAIETVAPSVAAAGLASIILETTGISLPPFVWALVGAALVQAYSPQGYSRFRTLVQVILSCMAGAAIAMGFTEITQIKGVHIIHLCALVGGAFAQPILQALFTKLLGKINGI